MKFIPKLTAALCSVAALFAYGPTSAQQKGFSDNVVKLGVLTDLSGLYSDFAGPGGVEAVKMAVEDFGGAVHGVPIQVIAADHFNKADIASATAREWLDTRQVDTLVDVTGSAVALAVLKVTTEKKKLALLTGVGTDRAVNEECTPYSVLYSHVNSALSNGTAKYVVKRGGDSWFFLTSDYAFGHSLEQQATQVVKSQGGKVISAVKHPLSTSDFSSYVLQAQASRAKVIGLASAGGDAVNAIKAMSEFGVSRKQTIAALLLLISDVHALGLQEAQGLVLTAPFYWDANDAARTWSRRFFKRFGKMPNTVQAANYSSVTHYLKAVEAVKTDDAATVIRQMKKTPINDFFAQGGKIRESGLMVHDMLLVEVKKPSESKEPWDYYKILTRIPAEDAYLPESQSTCVLDK